MDQKLKSIYARLEKEVVPIGKLSTYRRQSTWRHINELGLTNLYENSDDVKKTVGMMDGLAFLPLQHVNAGAVIVRNKMLQVKSTRHCYRY